MQVEMRKLLISWIESILLFLDRIDKDRPRFKNLTTYPAVALVLFREKIDPYEVPVDLTYTNDNFYHETIGRVQLMEIPGGGFGLVYHDEGETSEYIEQRGGQGG
jgi:hypothetical protein